MAVILVVLGSLQRRIEHGSIVAVGALALVFVLHASASATSPPPIRDTINRNGADVVFVRGYFARRPIGSPPTVYDGIWGNTNLVWFDLQAKNYFDLVQMSGVLFNRETAIEGARRAAIVRPFQLERYYSMEEYLPWSDQIMITRLFGATRESAVPTTADLFRVCAAEEHVDVAILKHDYDHLAAATNGLAYIYECADVRARAAAASKAQIR
jgi:hypothetical protein